MYLLPDPPEVETERTSVHTGIGMEAQLVCLVHAEPAPHVTWYKDTTQLGTTEKHATQTRGNRHTLIIRNVSAADFGNYRLVLCNKSSLQVYLIHSYEKLFPNCKMSREKILFYSVFVRCVAEKVNLRSFVSSNKWIKFQQSVTFCPLTIHRCLTTAITALNIPCSSIFRQTSYRSFFFQSVSPIYSFCFFLCRSCSASNILGKARGHLTLSGTAASAVFESSAMGDSPHNYNLTWSVTSYSPITEYRLFFRQQPQHQRAQHHDIDLNSVHKMVKLAIIEIKREINQGFFFSRIIM